MSDKCNSSNTAGDEPVIQWLRTTGHEPTRGTDGSAAFDLYAPDSAYVASNDCTLVDTRVCVALPAGFCGLVLPRSSMVRDGIACSVGVIDADYRGSIRVMFDRMGRCAHHFRAGDRLAQMLVVPVCTNLVVVDYVPETQRGDGGFGSTGV